MCFEILYGSNLAVYRLKLGACSHSELYKARISSICTLIKTKDIVSILNIHIYT